MECIEQFRKACGMRKTKQCFVFSSRDEVISGNWVYALILNGSIIYVGSSVFLIGRYSWHKANKQFDLMIAYQFMDHGNIYSIEESAISRIKPPLNKRGVTKRATNHARQFKAYADDHSVYYKRES
jgi:hypothetical protein